MQAGVPESFNVLLKELQALCLDVELINVDEHERNRYGAVSAAE